MITEAFLQEILSGASAFLLTAARALALIETAPLLSSDSNPQIAKIALAGFAAYIAFPGNLDLSPFSVSFLFLLAGEAIIGIIMGFFMTMIFATFSTAGQFFTLQMGFGASETFDPLAQEENPLMGQYLNLVAMLTFLTMGGFRELFLGGFQGSLRSISVLGLVQGREQVVTTLLTGLTGLFGNAMVMSLPILGTLFLTTLTTGLISKAAPQINILTEGFPISITVAFLLIMATMQYMVEAFSRIIEGGFRTLEGLFIAVGGAV